MANYYVDNTPFAGHNTGTAQAGGANTITLAAACAEADNAFVNYGIRIVSGTGAGQSRRITAYVAATKVATVHANWGTNPDATSEYDITVGCDSNDGTREGLYSAGDGKGAFAHPQAAANLPAAAGDVIYVKAGTPYTWAGSGTSAFSIISAGSSEAFITLAGYKTTPGDADAHWGDPAYRAVFDGTRLSLAGNGVATSLPDATLVYWCIRHIRVTGFAASAFTPMASSRGYVVLDNCCGETCGAYGANVGRYCTVNGGEYYGNALNGIFCNSVGNQINGARCYNNAQDQIQLGSGASQDQVVNRVLAYGVPATKYGICALGTGIVYVNHCTVDGAAFPGGARTGLGIRVTNVRSTVTNSIVVGCTTGLTGIADARIISRHNLVYDNDTDRTNFPTSESDIAVDPKFRDRANRDYRVKADSPAADTGCPLGTDRGFHEYMLSDAAWPTAAQTQSGVVFGPTGAEYTGQLVTGGGKVGVFTTSLIRSAA